MLLLCLLQIYLLWLYVVDTFAAFLLCLTYCRSLDKGCIELGVHIADVSYFVQPRSHLDSEAQHRSTTVYFADRRYDMLPAMLSSNLCSLLSNVDRYILNHCKMFRYNNLHSLLLLILKLCCINIIISACLYSSYTESHNLIIIIIITQVCSECNLSVGLQIQRKRCVVWKNNHKIFLQTCI